MDIERYRGDTYPDEITITDNSTGSVVDITGASFLLTVDPSASPSSSATNLYQIVGVIASPTAGTVRFSPSAGQANRVGYFYYDIQMTDVSSVVRTIASGRYRYVQDITK